MFEDILIILIIIVIIIIILIINVKIKDTNLRVFDINNCIN